VRSRCVMLDAPAVPGSSGEAEVVSTVSAKGPDFDQARLGLAEAITAYLS
jgi:hypothetical protein